MSGFFFTIEKRLQLALLAADAVVSLSAILLAYALRSLFTDWGATPVDPPFLVWTVLVGTQLLAMFVLDLYDVEDPYPHGRDSLAIGVATTATVLFVSLCLFFVGGRPTLGRGVLLLYVPLTTLLLTLVRIGLHRHDGARSQALRVLVIGADPSTPGLRKELGRSRLRSYQFVGELTADLSASAVRTAIDDTSPDVVVYSIIANVPHGSLDLLAQLRLKGLTVVELPTFAARALGWVPCRSVNDQWILECLELRAASRVGRNAHRALRLVAAGVLLVALGPLMLLIAAVVKLESRGPALFRQERLGRRLRPFTLLKFRTMMVDAESLSGPTWATANDPRITRAGRFLRRTGLDELPQLLNIIRGEMSFVGARPIRSFFAEKLAREIPHYALRFDLQPSATGWAQIRHDYAGSVEGQRRKFEYELFYLRYGSLLLDFYIILKTAQKLVLGRVGEVESLAPDVEPAPMSSWSPPAA